MPKKTKILSPEDLATFHKAVEGTKPLVQKKIRLAPTLKTKQRTPVHEHPEDVFNLSEADITDPVHSEAFIHYKHPSISNKTLRNLRKGQYNVEAMLDLHGMSVEKARVAVDQFLQHSLRERMRVVLIIHGKGHHSQMPILKNKLNLWLREINVVLAFCSASPEHGSRGATYVLLKRTTEENSFE